MYILDVVPLTNIPRPNPQLLSYYGSQEVPYLSLIAVPIGRKIFPALVVGVKDVKEVKGGLRKAYFQLKKIHSIVHPSAVLFEWQFKLAKWLSEYYWVSLGLVIKRFIPTYLYKTNRPYLPSENTHEKQVLWLFPDTSFFQKIEIPKHFVRISSPLTEKSEFQIFEEIASGNRTHILGTKRALFAPFVQLSEIHVYEETDASHKSWDQHPRYHAVTVAQKLAKLHNARIMYHSTLPSLASFHARISFHPLFSQSRSLENVSLLNLTKEHLQTPFSYALERALRECYMNGRQALLYVNRRGEASCVLCRDCGFIPRCPQCEIALVFHVMTKEGGHRKLLCHHCGYEEASPSLCPQCSSHELRSYGFGTERAEQELRKLFPKAEVLRLDTDVAINEAAREAIFRRFILRGNFLVTTSLIFREPVTKFDLVVALSPDGELIIPDFAQHEKLFFNLWRLTHWSKKSFLVQTYNPTNPVYQSLSSGDWKRFYRKELTQRKALNYPPFSSIIKLSYAHKSELKAREEAEILYKKLERQIVISHLPPVTGQLLGPAPAFLFRLKGKYHYHILLKIKPKARRLKYQLLSLIPFGWEVDVDPVDSL